jgi:hypothetical protein
MARGSRRLNYMERFRPLIWTAWLLGPAAVLAGIDQSAPLREGDAAANAALRYFRAYASLQQSRPPAIDMTALLGKYQTVPLDARAQELVDAGEGALRELCHGAALPQCVWALSVEDGLTADTSHRGVAGTLTALACLRARLRFQKGQSTDAVDDLLDAMTLTRHLSLDGTLASPLKAHTMEQGPATLLARNLPCLAPAELTRLGGRLDTLPAGASLASSLASHEKISHSALLRVVRGATDRKDLLNRLSDLEALRGRAPAFLDACGGTADGVARCVEELRPWYTRWIADFSLPPDQFAKEYETSTATLGKTNPVFRLLTPSVARLRWVEAYRQTQRALLKAAVAVQREGQGALARHCDPYDGRPFSYTAFDGGFRLQSRLKLKDKPLTVEVGSAKS